MSDIKKKLEAVESRFRKGSKQYEAAKYIVRQNRKIPTDERKAIVQEIPIAYKSLQGLFTELRKMGLYPPQETEPPYQPTASETSPEISHHVPEAPQPPLQEYVTKKDFDIKFETIMSSINNLASLYNEEPPSNPGGEPPLSPSEYEEEDEDEMIPPGELIPPGEMIIQGGSSTGERVFIKPKTRMYYDMSKQGAFHNYPGTREPGPLANFNGSLSDFFNIIVDEFFIRNYNADIGLTMRMPVK